MATRARPIGRSPSPFPLPVPSAERRGRAPRRAQRASWKLRRASPPATGRPTPTRRPRAERAAEPLGAPARRARTAPSSSVAGDQRAGQRAGGGDQAGRGLLAQRRRERVLDRGRRSRGRRPARWTTSAATRSASPNGSSRRASSAPASSPVDDRGQHVAGQPALGVAGHAAAQQLERDDRHRLVQREPVEVGQRAGVLDGHQPGLGNAAPPAARRRRRRRRRPERERPVGLLAMRGQERAGLVAARRARGARRAAPRPSSASSGRRKARWASGSPRASNTSTAAPISVASVPASASSPRSESTIRSSRSWAASARRRTAYCSLTSWVNAASVTAMNGTS